MPCSCENEIPYTPCTQTPCVEPNCSCQLFIKSDCVNNVTVDLPCLNVTKGKTLNEFLVAIDTSICAKFLALQSYFKLTNVGIGVGKIYKGLNIFGEKEIKSIKSGNLIVVNNLVDEIEISVDQTALNLLIPNVTASNVGNGLGEVFKNKVLNVLNFRKVKTENTGTGANILKVESTDLINDNVVISARKLKTENSGLIGESILKTEVEGINDITISAKKIDSNSLEITSTTDIININLPTASEIPSIIINSAYTGTVSTGSMAKPFKNIQDGLDYFVGGLPNTNLNPLRTAFRVVIQKGNGYTFTGHLEYNNLNLILEDGVIISSTPVGQDWLVDLDKYGDVNFDITINRLGNSFILLNKSGFRNRGTTINTPGIAGAYKSISLIGTGSITMTEESFSLPSVRVMIDSNSNNQAGYFNRGDIRTFNLKDGGFFIPNSRFLISGGNSIISFNSVDIVSGTGFNSEVNQNTKFIELIGNTKIDIIDCFIDTFFNISTKFNNLITTNNSITLFISGTRISGAVSVFLNVLSNTSSITMLRNLSLGETTVNFLSSIIPISSINFDENNITGGISSTIDLTAGNSRSVTNTVKGVKLESLVKRTARTGGAGTADDLPIGGVFINTNNNNVSTATHYRDIKI